MAAFDLIETMRFDPEEGVAALDRHMARLGGSARAFGFAFNRHDARNELHAATFRLRDQALLRLRLSPTGRIAIESRALPETPREPVAVRIVPLPVDPSDLRLTHKTSDRAFYDEARRAAGTFEVLFARRDGRLTEGSFTNLFVGQGRPLTTPPLADSLMPGVLRAELLDAGDAVEGPVVEADLAQGFLIGNSVRGLIAARLA